MHDTLVWICDCDWTNVEWEEGASDARIRHTQ